MKGEICFGPEADMCSALAHVGFGPIADSYVATKKKTASRRSPNAAKVMCHDRHHRAAEAAHAHQRL